MADTDRREFLQRTAGAAALFALPAATTADPRPHGGEPLRVGVVGAGRQGRAILSELQKMDDVRVTAVCDVVEGRLRGGLRRAQGAQGHADHRALLDSKDVDAVAVATPTHLHRAIVTDALDAGVHVWCEAPLAATVEDARAIALAGRGRDTVLAPALLARTNPIYRLAWSFVRAGALREMLSLQAHDHERTSWRTPASTPELEKVLSWQLDPDVSSGLPGERGTHQLDVLHWFVGAYPTSVRGTGAVRAYDDGRTVADTVHCDFAFGDGLRLSWESTLGSSYGGRYEQLTGSMATMKLAWDAGWLFKEADSPTQGWEVYANRETFHDDQGITLIADATKLAKQGRLREGVGLPQPPLYYGLADFVRAARIGEAPATSVEEAYRATVVGLRAQQAVLSGDEVAIPKDLLQVG